MEKRKNRQRIVVVLIHLLIWSVFFLIPYLARPDISEIRNIPFTSFLRWGNILQYVFLVGVFYFNAYWLIPRLLNRKKYFGYVFGIVAVLVAGYYLATVKTRYYLVTVKRNNLPMMREERLPGKNFEGRFGGDHPGMMRPPPVFPTMFLLAFVIASSGAYRFFLDKQRADKIQKERETEHLKSELGFLRSQISPHFIFNVLNTVVSLARTQPSHVEQTLIKLSGLIRYMLYDTDNTKVPLNQEIEYLEAYVDLQRLRFGEVMEIDFRKSGVLFGHAIEPMLLIPFVENAFKHGFVKVDKPSIYLSLREEEGYLYFEIKNRYNPEQLAVHDKYSGIGFANVKKRLDILYGRLYTLSVSARNQWYEVKLKIPLK